MGYPHLKSWIQELKKEKTEQNLETLSKIWDTKLKETMSIASQLVEIGFFKQTNRDKINLNYWIPFMYRDALKMVRGKASV